MTEQEIRAIVRALGEGVTIHALEASIENRHWRVVLIRMGTAYECSFPYDDEQRAATELSRVHQELVHATTAVPVPFPDHIPLRADRPADLFHSGTMGGVLADSDQMTVNAIAVFRENIARLSGRTGLDGDLRDRLTAITERMIRHEEFVNEVTTNEAMRNRVDATVRLLSGTEIELMRSTIDREGAPWVVSAIRVAARRQSSIFDASGLQNSLASLGQVIGGMDLAGSLTDAMRDVLSTPRGQRLTPILPTLPTPQARIQITPPKPTIPECTTKEREALVELVALCWANPETIVELHSILSPWQISSHLDGRRNVFRVGKMVNFVVSVLSAGAAHAEARAQQAAEAAKAEAQGPRRKLRLD